MSPEKWKLVEKQQLIVMAADGAKSLYKLVNGLRYFGVGSKVTRQIYKFPETYWVITRVRLSKHQEHGTIYGRLVWRGRPKPTDEKITAALKKQWSVVQLPDYASFKGSTEELHSLIPDSTERSV